MLDIRFVRDHADQVQENARRKGYDVDIQARLGLDNNKRSLEQRADELREKRNDIANTMKGGRPSDELITEGKAVKEQLVAIETDLRTVEDAYVELLKKVPNM